MSLFSLACLTWFSLIVRKILWKNMLFLRIPFSFSCPPDVHVAYNEGWKYEVDDCSCKRHVKTTDSLFIERNAAPAWLCQFLSIVLKKIDLQYLKRKLAYNKYITLVNIAQGAADIRLDVQIPTTIVNVFRDTSWLSFEEWWTMARYLRQCRITSDFSR